MADKKIELECFNKVLKCKRNIGKFACEMHQLLVERNRLVDNSSESPDIIIKTNTEVIGIEHCLTDLLFRKKHNKATSMTRVQHSTSERLVEKYKDEELLNADIRNGNALKALLDIVEEDFDLIKKFNYEAFINNFRRVCIDHNNNCETYRKKLKSYGSNHSILGCLVELPYSIERKYLITDNKGERIQALKGVPISIGMLETIQNMKGFDFVILCMYCLNKPVQEKDYLCYYFLPRNVKEGIKQQRIKCVDRFDFANKPIVKFPVEKYSIDDKGNTTFIASVTQNI